MQRCRQVLCDGRVIARRVRIRFCCKPSALLNRQCVVFDVLQHRLVVVGADDDGNAIVIFRCCPDHRRSTDVDIFDRVVDARVFPGNRCFEWIQIDDEQVDRFDAVFLHDALIGAAAPKEAAMNLRMQCLYAAVHDLRKAGFLCDFNDFEACFAQLATGAAGGYDFDAEFGETADKRDQTALVRNTDERTTYVEHGYTWSNDRGREDLYWMSE